MKRDVVFTFSYETYADAAARGMMRPPDRILQTLMSSDEVGNLLVANPFRSLASVAARGIRPAESFPARADRRLITPTRLARRDPVSVPAIVRTYRSYDEQLRTAAARAGMSRTAIVTTNPLVAAFCPFGWADTVTYFGRDDWLSSEARQAYWPAYAAAYRQISESEVGVAAVSQQIIDRIDPRGPAVVVPNGVDPGEWMGPRPAAPDWLAAIPGPRAIYVGTIDSRLDVEGIAHLAVLRPDLHIVLLGPTPEPGYTRALREIPNVHQHAGVGRSELVAALRNCDVSLLSHRRTALTEAMSPLKVYEYLAAGLPVVSIDLPPVRGIHERVTFSASTAEMAPQIDDALERGPLTDAQRAAFIEDNGWTSRHRAVLDLVLRSSARHRATAPANV